MSEHRYLEYTHRGYEVTGQYPDTLIELGAEMYGYNISFWLSREDLELMLRRLAKEPRG